MEDDYYFNSEFKFVAWSKQITADSYDVKAAAKIIKNINKDKLRGLDVGGGIGAFASALCTVLNDCKITVIDKSKLALNEFVGDRKCNLIHEDFFHSNTMEKYDFVIFKTVLHHFISSNDFDTRKLQLAALLKAKDLLTDNGIILIEENFYTGLHETDVTGRLIFEITKLNNIETITRKLGANTAGEGVRFRSLSSWNQLFAEAGLDSKWVERSPDWGQKWPIWQKIPLFAKERYQAVVGLVKASKEFQPLNSESSMSD